MSKNTKFLDYNTLIRDNLLNVVKHALGKTSDYGLTDGHHFYITFITNFKENVLPSYLVKDYPDNMMIVIENEFWNLKVFDNYFLVDLKFKGKIETISSRIDPSTRSILSRIIVDNSSFEIIPGQLMTVKVIYDETNQIGVPESSVTIQGNTAFVYAVEDDTAIKKNIKIGKRNFGKVSVLSGLNEGDKVITEGVSKVRDKAKIKIIAPK